MIAILVISIVRKKVELIEFTRFEINEDSNDDNVNDGFSPDEESNKFYQVRISVKQR